MDNQTPKPVRRIRYKGTHPKSFSEKYKELQPEQYADDIAKVIQQGRTPAGMHRSICADEIMEFLEKLPDALASGGRVATLSFHSGEDRRVKKSFQGFFREGIYNEVAPDPIRPSVEECSTNPRARSAKLRWAVKA